MHAEEAVVAVPAKVAQAALGDGRHHGQLVRQAALGGGAGHPAREPLLRRAVARIERGAGLVEVRRGRAALRQGGRGAHEHGEERRREDGRASHRRASCQEGRSAHHEPERSGWTVKRAGPTVTTSPSTLKTVPSGPSTSAVVQLAWKARGWSVTPPRPQAIREPHEAEARPRLDRHHLQIPVGRVGLLDRRLRRRRRPRRPPSPATRRPRAARVRRSPPGTCSGFAVSPALSAPSPYASGPSSRFHDPARARRERAGPRWPRSRTAAPG